MISPGMLRRGDWVMSLTPPLLTEPERRSLIGTVLKDVEVDGERTEVVVQFPGIAHRIVMCVRELRRVSVVEKIGDLDNSTRR